MTQIKKNHKSKEIYRQKEKKEAEAESCCMYNHEVVRSNIDKQSAKILLKVKKLE